PRKRHLSAVNGDDAVPSSAATALKESGNVPVSAQQRQKKTVAGRKRLSQASGNRRQSISVSSACDANRCLLCWQAPLPEKADLSWLDLRCDSASSVAAHYKCMLFASALPQLADPDDEVQPPNSLAGFELTSLEREARRGQRLRCSHCRRCGATAGCQEPRCSRGYHLPCAKHAGALLIHAGSFALHCPAHWPQKLLETFKERCATVRLQSREQPEAALPADNSEPVELSCPVCLEPLLLEAADAYRNVVFGLCCRNCFCHRSCAQAYANSAGSHFIKCPLCANTEKFRDALLDQGIEIPCRDASWELDENAYASHRYRPRLCSHPDCPDPEVDHYGVWLLKICYVCGADARHVTCAGMKTGRHRYCCQTCTAAIGPAAGSSRSRRPHAGPSSASCGPQIKAMLVSIPTSGRLWRTCLMLLSPVTPE
ncbi:hypothetical protein BOX15_Mlig022112g1, partial [Macrostomum lignano]